MVTVGLALLAARFVVFGFFSSDESAPTAGPDYWHDRIGRGWMHEYRDLLRVG